jgi:excisionase family DNA binding protein
LLSCSSVEGESYTVQEASRILRVTERTVRRRLERGELEGTQDPISGRWRVAAHSVTAAMPERPPRSPERSLEASLEAADLHQRVEDLQRQLGRLEGARELEAITQSTLREQLQRERERADRLEEELRDARRSWWFRIFGR